ncbi:MAG: TRAP transporter large permease subunit [bacterium]|nr:C4-dicarboxylate ABC transporter [Deltaproteobacteria bacterium]MCP4908710.1 TRAP transporter large permease subunit [bacterium]
MSIREWLAVAMFVAFILGILTGFPVAWVLGGVAVLFTAIAIIVERDFGFYTGVDWNYTSLVADRIWDLMDNWVLVALPMFVCMGLFLDRAGIAADLMRDVSRLFGRMRGGLAVSVALIGIILAASTGIIGASVVLLALLGLPPMLEARYAPTFAAGTVCAIGTLGILIPPSIMLVLMADRLAISVGDLFLGALLPGLLLASLYVAFLVIWPALRPEIAPAPDTAEVVDLDLVLSVFRDIVPTAALILAVLGSIFFGIATPTEASGVGAFGALLLAGWRRRLDRSVLGDILRETSLTTGYLFGIFVGASAFALVLRGLGGDELIARALLGLPFGPSGVVLAILFMTFLLGFFLDWIEITFIVLPLVAPVVVDLGFDLVWFTVLFAVCLQTSFLTPPVGFALFYVKGVAPPEIDVRTLYLGILPFVALQLVGLALIFVWPELATWLPATVYGN